MHEYIYKLDIVLKPSVTSDLLYPYDITEEHEQVQEE